jgi:hypothetical protein
MPLPNRPPVPGWPSKPAMDAVLIITPRWFEAPLFRELTS